MKEWRMRFWYWKPKNKDLGLETVTTYAKLTGRSRRAARRKLNQYVRQGSLGVFR